MGSRGYTLATRYILGRIAVIELTGELDLSNVPDLFKEINTISKEVGYHVIIDTTGVEYLDSVFMQELIKLWRETRKNDGYLKILTPNEFFRKIFHIVGLDDFIDVCECMTDLGISPIYIN